MITASHVDVILMRIFHPQDTVTILQDSAWRVLETQEDGTVTLAFRGTMATLVTDSASRASATCMGPRVKSVTQEQGSVCVRKSMWEGPAGSARMGLEQSELVAGSVAAIILDLRETFVMLTQGSAHADLELQGWCVTSARHCITASPGQGVKSVGAINMGLQQHSVTCIVAPVTACLGCREGHVTPVTMASGALCPRRGVGSVCVTPWEQSIMTVMM